jgi:hypothetical protein
MAIFSEIQQLAPSDFLRKGVMAVRHDQLPTNIPDRPLAR